MLEVWMPVVGYENNYQVSNLGRVKTVERINYGKRKAEIVLKQTKTSNGYLLVNITKDKVDKHERIHRLVAKAFIPNTENKRCVNHKNGIKTDNMVDNLEWATHSENHIHAYKNGLRKPAWSGVYGSDSPRSIPILKYSKDGVFIKRYGSAVEAAKELGITSSHIGGVCRGDRKTTGGFVWQYES